ncbi:sigma-54-dependent transcriptional regulator [Nafulsella turpanensis]|uniref:sigma-54-dependent transcriptional regulator n=1 Tax=Nafulsella turpanensis TaxID=1265690 RepID=UPI000344CBE4|nr:sigma-54 dependent transcriptional regulator [Nafulsella turpanensis]
MKKKQESLKIFVVEDDIWYSELLSYHLSLNPEYEVARFHTGKDCMANLYLNPDVICLDYTLPDITGEEVLRKIKQLNPDIHVVIISGQENIKTAVDLLKLGAYDYIVKDEDTKDRLWITISNIRQNIGLREEINYLKEEIGKKYDFENIIGNSEAIKKTFSVIEKAAKSKITVSISGETGTGKEVVAKAIHYNSARRNKPFMAVNITAIPKELMESELFGHEKGAFTGAQTRRIGLFEEADKGTIFLDEIGEMDINLQAKLLRVLQEMEVKRVGGNKPVPIDVRIIVATHKNLAEEVKNGNFREDLYYRLLGLPIQLPPLRERGNDILLISKHYIDLYCKENKIKKLSLSAKSQTKLLEYPFPGNIRELKAIIELACVMAEDETIQEENIIFNSTSSMADILAQELTMKEYNLRIIQSYLEKYDRNVLLVAKKLGIGKSTIYRLLQSNKI